MWMGKIGNKSAAFINHKHFHPGNYKNMEQVWLVEEKHKAALKRQKEMKEKREEELKILEIKRQLRGQEALKNKEMQVEEKKYTVKSSQLLNSDTYGLILPQDTSNDKSNKKVAEPKIVIESQYKENVFEHGHTAVFGSFYDTETKTWGYKCCKEVKRGTKCKNKRGTDDISRAEDTYSQPPKASKKKKIKSSHGASLTETLDRLKKLDALD